MAIATLDGIFAGLRPPVRFAKAATATLVAGRPASLWPLGGSPGAGSYNGTLNGVILESSTTIPNGALRHYDPASGNSYLAFLEAMATQAGVLEVRDRLWHNGGFTITSAALQAITTPAWPARCPTSGTDDTPATTGNGVNLALEISAATGAGTPTVTVNYTNDAGTTGRTATNVQATSATSAIGAVYDIGLAAGDTGVRAITNASGGGLTLSATWTSGTMNLVAYRTLARVPLQALISNSLDALTGAGTRLYDGVVPWLVFIPNTTTASIITGTYMETQG